MPGITNIAETHNELYDLYDAFNDKYFGGLLPKVVIGFEKANDRKSRSWTSQTKNWAKTGTNADAGEFYEVIIATEDIGQRTEDVAAMLLHEMCHLYAIINGIKDTSSHGFYHNESFRTIALTHGLVVEKEPRYGYAKSTLAPDAFEIAADVFNAVSPVYHVSRYQGESAATGRKHSSTRKFKCPSCKTKIRVTKSGAVNIVCGDCGCQFEEFF